MAVPQLPPQPGSMPVSRFRTIEPIAISEHHHVLKVVDALTGEPRALTLAVREPPLRFDELDQLSRLRHPSLPRVLEVGRTREPIGGAPAGALFALSEWVVGAPAWSATDAPALLADLAGALATLHAVGVVHGDVAPHNVQVTADGRGVLVGGPGDGEPRDDLIGLGALMQTLAADAGPLTGLLERLAAGRFASARDVLDALDHVAPVVPRRSRPAAPLAVPDGLALDAVLDTDDVAAIAAVMLGREPARAWAHAVRVASHGRPRVAIAMIRSVAGEAAPWAVDWGTRMTGGLAGWRSRELAAAPAGARRVAVAIATWGGRARIDRALAMLRADSKASAALVDVTELVRLGLAHRAGDEVAIDDDTRAAAEALVGLDVIARLAGATLDRLTGTIDVARDAAWLAPLFTRAALDPARAALACAVAEHLHDDGDAARALAIAHRAFTLEIARGGTIAARAAAACGDTQAAAAYARDAIAAGADPTLVIAREPAIISELAAIPTAEIAVESVDAEQIEASAPANDMGEVPAPAGTVIEPFESGDTEALATETPGSGELAVESLGNETLETDGIAAQALVFPTLVAPPAPARVEDSMAEYVSTPVPVPVFDSAPISLEAVAPIAAEVRPVDAPAEPVIDPLADPLADPRVAPLRELFAQSVTRWLSSGAFEAAATAALAQPPCGSGPEPAAGPAPEAPASPGDDLRLKPAVAALERAYVDAAMARAGGNQTTAAKLLGLSRFGLQKKLRRLDDEAAEAAEAEPADDAR